MLNIKSKEDAKKEGPALAKGVLHRPQEDRRAEMSKIAGPYFGGKTPHLRRFRRLGRRRSARQARAEDVRHARRVVEGVVRPDHESLKPVIAYLACRPAAGSGKVGMPGSMMYELPLGRAKGGAQGLRSDGEAAAGAVSVS